MSAYIIETLIKILILVAVFSALGGFATYIERKVLAYFQRRLGTCYVPLGFCKSQQTALSFSPKKTLSPKARISSFSR